MHKLYKLFGFTWYTDFIVGFHSLEKETKSLKTELNAYKQLIQEMKIEIAFVQKQTKILQSESIINVEDWRNLNKRVCKLETPEESKQFKPVNSRRIPMRQFLQNLENVDFKLAHQQINEVQDASISRTET